ncbi:hypothetical protein HNY73_009784 [Argiope bruennichi]|uniref:Uncharacterized protein n=2 Tax=Argiope bruennichi TaxID=94029 RepID=A0A8T0FDC6_ARGBR|nr:hypothetical protein HNY73_009784 [Argiope bruennichi]
MSEKLMNFTITPPKLKPKRRIGLLLSVLKALSCILGPLTVPTIVYGVEGCTTLFWWTLGISFFSSLLLLTFDIQKVKDLKEYFKINQCGGIRCLIKLGLMILVCGGGTYAYHIHFYELFSACLFVTGVIIGTFFSDITVWWNFRKNKNLPYVNFTKNSPTPIRPTFLDLRRKSLNAPRCASNLLPLKRQLSSPTKKPSNSLNSPTLDEVKSVPLSARSPSVSMSPVLLKYPSLSSSSAESDVPEVPQQISITTPTKRRVISAGLISLSPLANTPKTAPAPKRRLELPGRINPIPMRPSDISYHQTTPTFTYTECNVENLLSQNYSLFHM